MAEALPHKPRNTRLTAYYGLQPPSSVAPAAPSPSASTPSASPSPTHSTPPPSSRDQALQHATHLTQTLSLSDLLQRCTLLRESSDALHLSQRASTRRYYEHLSATSAAARLSLSQADELPPSAAAISSIATLAAGINARLAPARTHLASLEGARRAAQLRLAATRLAAALPPAYAELADLCTDPAAARDRLLLAARRAAVVLPAVRSLAAAPAAADSAHRADFAHAAVELQSAMDAVRADIAARAQNDDPYGLAVADAILLRRLLGDAPHVLIDAFCTTFARQLCADRPSEAARAAAGPVALAQARLHVAFATDRILPKAFAAGEKFAEIFASESDDEERWHPFVLWLSDTLDDAVAAPARRALRSSPSTSLGDADEVRGFLSAVDGLLAASLVAGGQQAKDITGTSSKGAAAHVDEVVQALGTGLRSAVREALAAQTAAAWQAAVNNFLSGDCGSQAADAVQSAVRSGCSQGANAVDSVVVPSEAELLHEVARYATRDSGLRNGIARDARAGMLLRELGRRCRGGAGAELEEMGGRVFMRIREDVLERVQDILYGRLQLVRGLESGSPDVYAEHGGISEMTDLVKELGLVGAELGVETFRCNSREDELLGHDQSVVSSVVKVWVELVRESSILSEAGLHAIQMDSFDVADGVGSEDAFVDVRRAALERCAESDAAPMPIEHIRVACQERRTQRGRLQATVVEDNNG